jgi:TonB family protein
MTPASHAAILDEPDSLKRPFTFSLALHAGIFGALTLATVVGVGTHEQMGDPNAQGGGGAFSVTAVKSIPLPGRTGPLNKVASDTESAIPEPVEVKPRPKVTKVKEPEDGIPLKSKNHKRAAAAEERWQPSRKDYRAYDPHQVYSNAGQAATSPLFGQAPGSGGVGVGNGMPFGTRFGSYALIIRDRVAQHWRTEQVDGRIRSLPAAIISFEIQRDGRVRNVRVVQSSGNVALDYSAQRAVTEAAPLPALPAGFSGDVASIEFWFELKR